MAAKQRLDDEILRRKDELLKEGLELIGMTSDKKLETLLALVQKVREWERERRERQLKKFSRLYRILSLETRLLILPTLTFLDSPMRVQEFFCLFFARKPVLINTL